LRIVVIVLLTLFATLSPGHAADHAVVLLYHHVSDDTPPSTSISPDLFRQHLDYLDREGFNVLPLSQVLKTLAEGGSVPDKTVSLTFDDAYRSVYDEALPMLQEKKWPFTVFVSTEAIDRGYSNYLEWSQLRELLAAGAEIGNHSHSHAHLVRHLEGESQQQWHERVAGDIAHAQQQLAEELGIKASMFAYPYGEHTPELREVTDELGLIGISQQSGAVGHGFDRLAVPRFPMATGFADMKRFAISVYVRPLPVADVSSGPAVQIAGRTGEYSFDFTLLPGDYRAKGLACYSNSGDRLPLKKVTQAEGRRIFVQLPSWEAGRRKINCTAPSATMNGVYYWLSHLWLVKEADGNWYQE